MSWYGTHPIMSRSMAKRMIAQASPCRLCVYWVRCGYDLAPVAVWAGRVGPDGWADVRRWREVDRCPRCGIRLT